jgi:hypothetical protein
MVPLAEVPVVVTPATNQRVSLPFSIADKSRCVELVAAGDPGVAGLDLALEDEHNRLVERHATRGRVGMLGPTGPICLEETGAYRFAVAVTGGSGGVALMAWQAK